MPGPGPRARSAALLLFLTACGGAAESADDAPRTPDPALAPPSTELAACVAAGSDAPSPLPRVREEQLSLAYWLERAAQSGDLDEPLLSPAQIGAHDAAVGHGRTDLPFARTALREPPDAALLARELTERLAFMRERVEDGRYVDAAGARLSDARRARYAEPATMPGRDVPPERALRVAVERIPLRCGPEREPVYSAPPDLAFDRNACSTIERQEAVQVLAPWPDGLLLVRTRYALGWIAADAPLSPVLDDDAQNAWIDAPRLRPLHDASLASGDGASIAIDPDVLLASDGPDALFATRDGVHRATPPAGAVETTARPLTRRAFLTEAFRHLGEPYGWGGMNGGLDCSELVMDVLATFGLDMPRHSARQAESGTFSIPVPAELPETERMALLDSAARRGVVLLHFPGHVMIYLGRSREGVPMILHAFAEYLEPCANADGARGDLLRRVSRVSISDLELGRDTARRAFIQRVDRIVVIGHPPGPELEARATARTASPVAMPTGEACDDSLAVRVFHSPARPHPGQPLRFVVASQRDLAPYDMRVVDPSGREQRPPVHALGGPPFTYWVEIERPEPGRYQVAIGDGPQVAACDSATVARTPPGREPHGPPFTSVWEPRITWEADAEALYAAFVEQLFAYPDDDRTWTSLTQLLRDREHNLLYDHLSLGEDSNTGEGALELVPDCADLAYFLRAYFAWKLRLPFAFRQCSRGRAGQPPNCGPPITPQMEHTYPNEVDAFRWFIRRHVQSGAHSASGRTAPSDDDTDLYPIPLTRPTLPPGTVFADPYGHVLILIRWAPAVPVEEGGQGWGALMGADAQPDGTIGRRTFWRGTFLFSPDTRDVGAGFKAWRPVLYDRRTRTYTELLNSQLTEGSGYTPFSLDQYRGSLDDFYDRMDSLVDPGPLDAERWQLRLVEALHESVVRRVVSVENGEDWHRSHPTGVIPMPEGTDIFQTEGPWEDFSTPSRDMRLLIAIDTVMAFPEQIRRTPARFRIPEGTTLDALVQTVTARRDAELASHRFGYTRSDGSTRELTLADLVARQPGIEVSWNPNDCVELRWGADLSSEEGSTCRRRAPADQRARMERMRAWFHERMRPTR